MFCAKLEQKVCSVNFSVVGDSFSLWDLVWAILYLCVFCCVLCIVGAKVAG